jgi:hypothetical protein
MDKTTAIFVPIYFQQVSTSHSAKGSKLASPFVIMHRILLKRTDKEAGPSGLAVISLQKVDSLLVFLNVTGS